MTRINWKKRNIDRKKKDVTQKKNDVAQMKHNVLRGRRNYLRMKQYSVQKNILRIRLWIIVINLIGSSMMFGYFLQRYWVHRDEAFVPDYPRITLTEETDYETFLFQTGLGKSAVDKLLEEGDFQTILDIQDAFFQPLQVSCTPLLGWFTREERLVSHDNEGRVNDYDGGQVNDYDKGRVNGHDGDREIEWSGTVNGSSGAGPDLIDLQPGDIILTLSTHSVGWRHGHAALVIDEDTTLECAVLGTDSSYGKIQYWRGYSNYCVLRVKNITPELQEAVAEYACSTLCGVPYHLTSGFIGAKAPEPDDWQFGLQCAYLAWYAWNHFGYDLDSDGGRLVSAYDLLHSDLLEVVQIYGMDPSEVVQIYGMDPSEVVQIYGIDPREVDQIYGIDSKALTLCALIPVFTCIFEHYTMLNSYL